MTKRNMFSDEPLKTLVVFFLKKSGYITRNEYLTDSKYQFTTSNMFTVLCFTLY